MHGVTLDNATFDPETHGDDIDVTARNEDGKTPLMHAIDYEDEEMVKMLLARDDLDVNVRDRHGRTALHRAIMYGVVSILVELLLGRNDINTEIREGGGRTPMDQAIEDNNQSAIEVLKDRRGNHNLEQ
ncbi:uncharacterized protein Z519_06728 [Cladophialophora bantiana CBS 173.52]|uniref:Ankyrin repeat protein n=1 Tax=Cladophialophora bantiana (strain ATCC 10958 / CBS 173.52 / CDC B-1940 / NIH 8579) TaxID=1442370 RepID=A0A0D2I7T7_CLAB1|nr:uncharacterized protein Z519_06728 [Cladophialophora bantiana CBS 173.52]KIW92879.1 hypothetical protein Z519_06728 [Cladophialophora bantiana CBS 173.52]